MRCSSLCASPQTPFAPHASTSGFLSLANWSSPWMLPLAEPGLGQLCHLGSAHRDMGACGITHKPCPHSSLLPPQLTGSSQQPRLGAGRVALQCSWSLRANARLSECLGHSATWEAGSEVRCGPEAFSVGDELTDRMRWACARVPGAGPEASAASGNLQSHGRSVAGGPIALSHLDLLQGLSCQHPLLPRKRGGAASAVSPSHSPSEHHAS